MSMVATLQTSIKHKLLTVSARELADYKQDGGCLKFSSKKISKGLNL
jgi:hypothetical protein